VLLPVGYGPGELFVRQITNMKQFIVDLIGNNLGDDAVSPVIAVLCRDAIVVHTGGQFYR
jgi:hypothetical protein